VAGMMTFNDLMALSLRAWFVRFRAWQLNRRKQAALRYIEVLKDQMRNDLEAKRALQNDVMLIDLEINNLR
jgi:hypothetical protein